MHFDLNNAVPLAGLAPAAFDIERKPSWGIAACPGFWQAGKPFPDRGKCPCIGGWVGARRPPNRRLVNINNLIQQLKANNICIGRRKLARFMQFS